MKVPSTLLLLSLLLPGADAAEHRPFGRMDVFQLEWISDPQISPDGDRIIFVRNGMDVMTDGTIARLWIVATDGSGARPLTGRDEDESNPIWSPDGSRVAFTSKTDDGSEIFVSWVDEGRTTRLTRLDQSPSGLAWSPDGTRLAFSALVPEDPPVLVTPPKQPTGAEWPDAPRVTTRLYYERDGSGYIEPGYAHFFVIPALGGAPRRVTSGNFQHSGRPAWSAAGDALIFSGNRNPDWERNFVNSEIYRVSVETGETVALTDRNGPDAEPAVSPDGRRIAWVSFEDKVQTYQVATLHVMDADGRNKRELTAELDRSVSGVHWQGNRIWFQYDDMGDTRIAYATLDGRINNVATGLGGTTIGRPYGGGSFTVSRNGTVA